MPRAGRNLFHRPRRRRRGRWIALTLLGTVALTAGALAAAGRSPPQHGHLARWLGEPLAWRAPARLPDDARQAFARLVTDSPAQVLVALADLNRDRIPEILVAPAEKRADLFVARSPLRVMVRSGSSWTLLPTSVSCRPPRLGSFRTRDWWDLPCPPSGGVLRFDGTRYRPATD